MHVKQFFDSVQYGCHKLICKILKNLEIRSERCLCVIKAFSTFLSNEINETLYTINTSPVVDPRETVLRLNPIWLPKLICIKVKTWEIRSERSMCVIKAFSTLLSNEINETWNTINITPVVDAGERILRLNAIWLPQSNLHKSEKLKIRSERCLCVIKAFSTFLSNEINETWYTINKTPVVDARERVLRLNPIWLPQANLHKSEKLKNQVWEMHVCDQRFLYFAMKRNQWNIVQD